MPGMASSSCPSELGAPEQRKLIDGVSLACFAGEAILMQLRIGISAILFLAAMGSQAPARENDTYIVCVNKCFNWCDAHNSTQKSRSSCYGRCVAYWLKNASDAALIHS